MEEQKFQKRLLHYDDAGFTRQMNDFQRNCKILNQITEKYEELFSEKITQKLIKHIFERDFDSLLKAAKTSIGKKIKSDLLAEVSLKLFEEKFSVFVVEVSRFLDLFQKTAIQEPYPTPTPLLWFSINPEGKFFIPDETVEKIKERSKNYISTPREQELYDKLEQLAKLNNEIFNSLGKRAKAEIVISGLHRHKIISDLLTSDSEGNAKVDPENNFKFLSE